MIIYQAICKSSKQSFEKNEFIVRGMRLNILNTLLSNKGFPSVFKHFIQGQDFMTKEGIDNILVEIQKYETIIVKKILRALVVN